MAKPDDPLLPRLARLLVADGLGPFEGEQREMAIAALVIISAEQNWQYVFLLCLMAARAAQSPDAQAIFAELSASEVAQALIANHRINHALHLEFYSRDPQLKERRPLPASVSLPAEPLRLPARRWNLPGTDRWVSIADVEALLAAIQADANRVSPGHRQSWVEAALLHRFKELNDRLKDGALWRLLRHAGALNGMTWRRATRDTRREAVHVRLHYATGFLTTSVRVGSHTERKTHFLPSQFLPLLSDAERGQVDSHFGARQLAGVVHRTLAFIYTADEPSQSLPLLQGLYRLLLQPILDRPKVRRAIDALPTPPTLVVATHGPLAQLPFSALHDGERHLIDRFNVVQAPPLYGEGEFAEGDLDWEAMLGGDPLAKPPAVRVLADTQWLDHTKDELAAYQALRNDGAQVSIISDETAGPWNTDTLRWLLESPGVAVLSAHMQTAFNDAKQTALITPGGTPLHLCKILDAPLMADLVVLAGCVSSAQTDWFGPNENSLVSLLRRRGVRSVIATLWPVRDYAARIYNETLIAELVSGRSRAVAHGEALRKVRRTIASWDDLTGKDRLIRQAGGQQSNPRAASGRSLDHPRFWAPFVLSGAWR